MPFEHRFDKGQADAEDFSNLRLGMSFLLDCRNHTLS